MRGRKLPGGHRRSVKHDSGGDRRKHLMSYRRDSAYGCEHPPSRTCELCRPEPYDETDERA